MNKVCPEEVVYVSSMKVNILTPTTSEGEKRRESYGHGESPLGTGQTDGLSRFRKSPSFAALIEDQTSASRSAALKERELRSLEG
jgi:hypothetical protein